jgi:hypothetical protein
MTTNTNEPMNELVNMETLICKMFEVDTEYIKCFFQWWEKYETMFFIVGFLACQILNIAGSQIQIGRIQINFKRCHLHFDNFN